LSNQNIFDPQHASKTGGYFRSVVIPPPLHAALVCPPGHARCLPRAAARPILSTLAASVALTHRRFPRIPRTIASHVSLRRPFRCSTFLVRPTIMRVWIKLIVFPVIVFLLHGGVTFEVPAVVLKLAVILRYLVDVLRSFFDEFEAPDAVVLFSGNGFRFGYSFVTHLVTPFVFRVDSSFDQYATDSRHPLPILARL
jgi:hypothetical protein